VQHAGRIARSAAESRADRNALAERHGNRRRTQPDLRERARHQVIRRERRRVAGERKPLAGRKRQLVRERDRHHDAAQRVVAVGATREDFEGEVDLRGGCERADFHRRGCFEEAAAAALR